jgi:hypothetical protein
MLKGDFSQLPVMPGEREVKGMITWRSIGARLAPGAQCNCVRDCREQHREVNANLSLFHAIPEIVQHGYVLVRAEQTPN